jgi:hypothetical protein
MGVNVGDQWGVRLLIATYHDAVVPGENGQLVELSDKIPAGSRVARDKDSKRDNREGVHGTTTASCQLGK